ncbi:hypothetical protein CFIO01_06813 [Colletotrichum fioriniae PJ7]|uniref:Uncharacterized protein n=1 Tax=Colletotrichum fioriniae PJ7 TaxID=1445577 RepID=A0A010R934_9PEZI|nr:hypothetical protein CFIO01_06813 [Colletotrichum fioriniae PJ7]
MNKKRNLHQSLQSTKTRRTTATALRTGNKKQSRRPSCDTLLRKEQQKQANTYANTQTTHTICRRTALHSLVALWLRKLEAGADLAHKSLTALLRTLQHAALALSRSPSRACLRSSQPDSHPQSTIRIPYRCADGLAHCWAGCSGYSSHSDQPCQPATLRGLQSYADEP